MKRFVDIIVSMIALMVLFPFALIIMVILRFTGEGEIFYVHPRIGKGGRTFGLIKFATMLKESPNLGTGDITVRNDPRVLPFGRFLRKTKINELPQIINVLKGDMSIIGPRPLTSRIFDYYSDTVKQVICTMRPGLSGMGSIIFRDEEQMMAHSDMACHDFYRERIIKYKGNLEIWYEKNRSLRVDVTLVFLTIWAICFPKNQLIFRIFKSIPHMPDFLSDEQHLNGKIDTIRTEKDASRIVDIEPSVLNTDQRVSR